MASGLFEKEHGAAAIEERMMNAALLAVSLVIALTRTSALCPIPKVTTIYVNSDCSQKVREFPYLECHMD